MLNWLHYEINKVQPCADKSGVTFTLLDVAPPPEKPRKMTLWQYFSKKYYDRRVKVHYDAQWARVKKYHLGDPPLTVLKETIEAIMDAETEEFRTQLQQTLNAEHKEAMRVYNEQMEGIERAQTSKQPVCVPFDFHSMHPTYSNEVTSARPHLSSSSFWTKLHLS